MSRRTCVFVGLLALVIADCRSRPEFDSAPAHSRRLYAQGNLRYTKGYCLVWLNWQRYGSYIPAGTALDVWPKTGTGDDVEDEAWSRSTTRKWYLRDPETGKTYLLEMGSSDAKCLDRFVGPEAPELSGASRRVRDAIEEAQVLEGMTKVQTLAALGPPARAGRDQSYTRGMTRAEVLATDRWIYATSRGGAWIVVRFDRNTGLVMSVEGP